MGHTLKNTKLGALLHALGHPALGWFGGSLLALALMKVVGVPFDPAVLIGGVAGGIAWPLIQEGVLDLKLLELPVGQDQLIDFTNYLPIVGVAVALTGGIAGVLAGLTIFAGSAAAEYSRGVYR